MTTPPGPPPGYDPPGGQPPQVDPYAPGPPAGYGGPPPGYGGPPPAYGAPPQGWGPQSGSPRNGLATAGLVLGILGVLGIITFFFGLVFGILALVFGVIGRKRVRRHEANNGGVATAAIVLGAIAIVGSIAYAALIGAVLFQNKDSVGSLSDCLATAGDDQAAIEQCQRDFENDLLD